MQRQQSNNAKLDLGRGKNGPTGGGKGFTKLFVGLVCAAALGGFLWLKSPAPTPAPPTQTPISQSGQQRAINEVPGTVQKFDLGQMLAKAQAAPKGTDEAKSFDEAKTYMAQNLAVIDQALKETSGEIIVIADTSGSMNSDVSKVGIVNAYLAGASATRPVTVLWVDDAMRGFEQLAPGNSGHWVGGGGTSLKPGFDYLAKKGVQPGLVIYLTDGHCTDFPANPGYPVLWMLVRSSGHFKAPWGVTAGQ
jgi:hypothetical protein